MSIRLKLFGLGLLVTVATAGISTMTASASNTEGHFVTDGLKVATLEGLEANDHKLEFQIEGALGSICDKVEIHNETGLETETSMDLFFKYSECRTTGSGIKFNMKAEGCPLIFFAAKGSTEATEQTMKFSCSSPIEIFHPNCTIKIPSQGNLSGVTYTKFLQDGKDAITVDAAIKLTAHYEAGACVMLGTIQTGTLKGSFTVRAVDAAGFPVNYTFT